MQRENQFYRLLRGIIALIVVLIAGTLGYHFIEGWSILDSLYMTVTTLSTVGFREVHDLSTAGRVFTIILIFVGVGTLFYLLTNLVGYFVEGEFGIRIGRRRMENKISRLNNHFVICGFGRVGEAVARSLVQEGNDFIVIDTREDCYNRAQKDNYLAIMGDATKNDILAQARIDKARGVIVAFGDDASNLYAIMAARELNPTVPIIARANSEDAAKRMKLAGAEHVIAPEALGGQQMARLAVRPTAVQFIETVLASRGEELIIEEIKASSDTSIIGSTVKQIEDRFPRIKILALKSEDGTITLNPAPDTVMEKSHSFTAFGPLAQMQNLEGCCQYIPPPARHIR